MNLKNDGDRRYLSLYALDQRCAGDLEMHPIDAGADIECLAVGAIAVAEQSA